MLFILESFCSNLYFCLPSKKREAKKNEKNKLDDLEFDFDTIEKDLNKDKINKNKKLEPETDEEEEEKFEEMSEEETNIAEISAALIFSIRKRKQLELLKEEIEMIKKIAQFYSSEEQEENEKDSDSEEDKQSQVQKFVSDLEVLCEKFKNIEISNKTKKNNKKLPTILSGQSKNFDNLYTNITNFKDKEVLNEKNKQTTFDKAAKISKSITSVAKGSLEKIKSNSKEKDLQSAIESIKKLSQLAVSILKFASKDKDFVKKDFDALQNLNSVVTQILTSILEATEKAKN